MYHGPQLGVRGVHSVRKSEEQRSLGEEGAVRLERSVSIKGQWKGCKREARRMCSNLQMSCHWDHAKVFKN